MENHSNNCIVRSLPNGKISHLSVAELNRMIAECEREANKMSNIAERVKRLNSMARTCMEAGYYHSARHLYRRAIDVMLGCDESGEISLKVMRYRELFYTAARGIDAAMRKVSPRWGSYAYDRAVYYFMLTHEDYNFFMLGIDNDWSLKALEDFEERHNITRDNWLDF